MKSINRVSFRIVCALIFCSGVSLSAQNPSDYPSRFGILGGIGLNSASLDSTGIDSYVTTSTSPLNDVGGEGAGMYLGILYEYVPGLFGFQIRGTYDSRDVDFGAGDAVSATARYVSIEPSLRISPVSGLHFLVGPSLQLMVNNRLDFTNTSGTLSQTPIGNAKNAVFGLWGGIGFDLPIATDEVNGSAWYLTPFADISWLPEQVNDLGSVPHDWHSLTFRGGLQLKFGSSNRKEASEPEEPIANAPFSVTVRTPNSGVTDQRNLVEYFPLLNYMFFSKGSTKIPSEYRRLSPDVAAAFTEESIFRETDPTAGPISGSSTRSQRQMAVYNDVMNIMGSRLRANPSSQLTIVGAAASTKDAKSMADSVKNYLVNNFAIDPTRIATKGQTRPPHTSGTRSTPVEDLDLVAEENIRIELLSDDPNLMKPVRIESLQEQPLENDVVVELNLNSQTSIKSWSLTVNGNDNDFSQIYGPFYGRVARINATPMLEQNSDGEFTAVIDAETHAGQQLRQTQLFDLRRKETPPVAGTRYSILFEYDDSKTVGTYDSFLRNEVAPKIPNGSVVYVHGHTDVTGKEDYNGELSSRRAVEAQNILSDELKKLGRTARFDTYGFGENSERAPFENDQPAERYYNRTVIIEIIPPQ